MLVCRLPPACASPCAACATEPEPKPAIEPCNRTLQPNLATEPACLLGPAPPAAGSPHRLYQQWIEKYGGLEYESLVLQVIHMANEVAAELSDTQVCG